MKKLTQMTKNMSHTEKVLALSFAVLAGVLTFQLIVSDPLLATAFADENSSSSGGSDGGSESSGNDESSGEDSVGSTSVDEESVVSEESNGSFLNIPTLYSDQESEASTPSVPSEVSVTSTSSETSDVSVFSGAETSTASVVSEVSEVSVDSVSSGDNIEDFDDVEFLDGDVAVITTREKLFFLFPVDIDQTVELGEDGTVLDVRQSLLNLLLSLFSF